MYSLGHIISMDDLECNARLYFCPEENVFCYVFSDLSDAMSAFCRPSVDYMNMPFFPVFSVIPHNEDTGFCQSFLPQTKMRGLGITST